MKVQGNVVHAFAINLFYIFVIIIPFVIPYTFLFKYISYFSLEIMYCLVY